MDYDDIEFVEGVHKSVRRRPLNAAADEQIAGPTDAPPGANEPAPGPERERNRYGPWLRVVVVLVLICVLGGGAFALLKLHATPQTQVAKKAPNHNTICATTGAPVDIGKGVPQLNSVVALSNSDIWTVGNLGDQTLTEHWDGARWQFVSSPNGQTGAESQTLATGSRFNSVTAVSANDIWAVGTIDFTQVYFQQAGIGLNTLIEHWDGSKWSVVPSPNGTPFSVISTSATNGILLQGRNELRGIAAVSANDIWAVGSTNSSSFYTYNGYDTSQEAPLVEHWDGHQWSITALPALPATATLTAVTAIAPDNVWAVGAMFQQNNFAPLIAHWDGHQWSVASNTLQGGGLLSSISASSANDIWVAGFGGALAHWDGTSWSQVSYPPISTNSFAGFQSVFALSSDNVWFAGFQQADAHGASGSPVLEHWDGHNWKNIPQAQTITGQLNAITVVKGQVWGVGTSVQGLQQIQNPLIETNCV